MHSIEDTLQITVDWKCTGPNMQSLCKLATCTFCITHPFNLVAEEILHHLRRENQLLSVKFLEQWNGTLIHEVRHVRHLKTLLGQNYQKRQEGTTPLHSPAMLEMSFSSVLHADVVLQLDLKIPNLCSAEPQHLSVFGSIGEKTRTPGFHALAEMYVELLQVVILLHNFYEHFNARPHQVRLDRTQELVWQETCFPHFLLFSPVPLRCRHCTQRWVPHPQSAALTLREQPELEQ